MAWTVGYHKNARAEADAQPDDIRAKLDRFLAIIEENGFEDLPPKSVKHLRDKLWEFRMKGKDGIARALYVTMKGQNLVVVHVFAKKGQKTPPREIKLALARAEELE